MKAIVVSGLAIIALAALALTLASPAQAQRREPMPGGAEIGVYARDVDPAEAERLKVQGGAFVEDVRPEMPGARAGLQKSDVVVEFDGERVRSARQFSRLVQERPPGRDVRMTVMRDGNRHELRVTPVLREGARLLDDRLREAMERAADIPFNLDLDVPWVVTAQRSRLGVTVQALTPQLATYFGVKEGLLVSAVVDNSPAARAGVTAGDVLTGVNGRPVGSVADLNREIRTVAETAGADVRLQLVRDKKPLELGAKIEPRDRRPMRRVRPIRAAPAA
jgi:serine protease Do